jgi:CRP-like cAMP-binding protein
MSEADLDEILRRADEKTKAALARVLDTEGDLARVVAEAERRRSRDRKAVSFWEELTESERAALRPVAVRREYPVGAVLIREGDPATFVTVIESGWVKVITETPDRHESLLAVRGPGDIVGEVGVFHGRPRSATLIAIGPIHSLYVPAERFAAFLEKHPHARRVLTETIRRRMEEAAATPPPDTSAHGIRRLAFLLFHLADQFGSRVADRGIDIRPRLSQQELAGLVSASRQTIARVLRHWRDRGLIRTGRRTITVLSPGALRSIALDRDTQPPPAEQSVIFAAEIAEFSGRSVSARDTLHRLLASAFEDAGIPWNTCLREDRGDGVLAVTPTRTTAAGIGSALLDRIQSGLRQHNLTRHNTRIRLRVALHTGEVHRDEYGPAGPAVEHVLHLLDAKILREGLTGTDLGLIVSDPFYQDVTRHIDPEAFHQVTVEPAVPRSPHWRRLSAGHAATATRPPVRGLHDLLRREFDEADPRRTPDRRGFVLVNPA